MPPLSRRGLLSTVAVAGVALAGCSGVADSDDAVETCTTSVVSGGATDGALAETVVTVDDGTALLVVSVNVEAADGMDHLAVDGSTDDYRIPVTDGVRPTYRQALGPLPRHGRATVEARTGSGETLDAITVEYGCRRRSPADS